MVKFNLREGDTRERPRRSRSENERGQEDLVSDRESDGYLHQRSCLIDLLKVYQVFWIDHVKR